MGHGILQDAAGPPPSHYGPKHLSSKELPIFAHELFKKRLEPRVVTFAGRDAEDPNRFLRIHGSFFQQEYLEDQKGVDILLYMLRGSAEALAHSRQASQMPYEVFRRALLRKYDNAETRLKLHTKVISQEQRPGEDTLAFVRNLWALANRLFAYADCSKMSSIIVRTLQSDRLGTEAAYHDMKSSGESRTPFPVEKRKRNNESSPEREQKRPRVLQTNRERGDKEKGIRQEGGGNRNFDLKIGTEIAIISGKEISVSKGEYFRKETVTRRGGVIPKGSTGTIDRFTNNTPIITLLVPEGLKGVYSDFCLLV